MDRSGEDLQLLASVGGSVFYGCKLSGSLFFSTAVEPSDTNISREAEVWHSPDGKSWDKIAAFQKDWLSMKYFQYGQVLFPSIIGEEGTVLYFTPFATNVHGKTVSFEL